MTLIVSLAAVAIDEAKVKAMMRMEATVSLVNIFFGVSNASAIFSKGLVSEQLSGIE